MVYRGGESRLKWDGFNTILKISIDVHLLWFNKDLEHPDSICVNLHVFGKKGSLN